MANDRMYLYNKTEKVYCIIGKAYGNYALWRADMLNAFLEEYCFEGHSFTIVTENTEDYHTMYDEATNFNCDGKWNIEVIT